jgi:hypothetical protein
MQKNTKQKDDFDFKVPNLSIILFGGFFALVDLD